MNYLTSMQTAEKWGITKRRVNSLCKEGMIPSAVREGNRWMIPEDIERPVIKKGNAVGNIMKLPLPIGISDYRTAVSEYYYVDKTLLIRDLLDYRPLVSLFTRPRRFGKTLNMDMLRVFFEHTKEDNSTYFVGTNIWQAGERYRREQGRYPVIFLTFKDVKYSTWNDMRINLQAVIQAEYKRHLYLLEGDRLAEYDKDYIRKVLEGKLEQALWSGTLGNLALFLDMYHGIAPIIIIDEYDTPIQQGYMKGFYEETVSFMRNFLSGGLKDNRHLTMAFLTGILRVAKESIFSGLNNLNVNSVLEQRYSSYFGFTEDEVKKLLTDYNHGDSLDEVKAWYDGYHFGNTEIYNPWSVLNYVDGEYIPKTFWQSTGSNDIVGEIVKEASDDLIENLHSLLNGNSVDAYIDTSVVYPEIHDNPISVYSFLLMAGYLTVHSDQKLMDGNSICQIRIPNREISIVYEKEILNRMEASVPATMSASIQRALILGNAKQLQKELECFMMAVISYHDAANEGFYHGMMLGITAMLNQYYWITSNRESGNGRYDIMLKPRNEKYPAFVIELKALKQKDKKMVHEDILNEKAQEALQQIEQMDYLTELEYYGCKDIRKMGIAFCGKSCRIAD